MFSVLFFGTWDLSSLTRIKSKTSALGMWSLNQWTTRELPISQVL